MSPGRWSLLAGDPALRPRPARKRPRGRGVRLRHAADPADRGARRPGPRTGARGGVASRVVDWSGGTRIGASLKAFNDLWGRRALSRGAVVVIVSDGWEREDTAMVGREMARLARCAYAVVWVNPLKGHPDYEPLAGRHARRASVRRPVPARAQSGRAGGPGRHPRGYREEARGMKDVLGRHRALAREGREGGDRDRRRHAQVGAAPGRREARSVGERRDRRLGVGRVRRVGCLRDTRAEVLETGTPKLVSYGIKDEEAWEVGLPCGGEIDVFVERLEE